MRKIVVQTFVTLDGVMQAPGGPDEDPEGGFEHGGWSVNYWDEQMARSCIGRWPSPMICCSGARPMTSSLHTGRGRATIRSRKFNAARKYVATSSPGTLAWDNSEVLVGDVAAAVAALRESDGPTLSVQGSSRLIQTLLANDLVDELALWVFPLVLGRGKRLFGEGTIPAGFEVTDTTVSSTGVVITGYRRAALREPGSFALEAAEGEIG